MLAKGRSGKKQPPPKPRRSPPGTRAVAILTRSLRPAASIAVQNELWPLLDMDLEQEETQPGKAPSIPAEDSSTAAILAAIKDSRTSLMGRIDASPCITSGPRLPPLTPMLRHVTSSGNRGWQTRFSYIIIVLVIECRSFC